MTDKIVTYSPGEDADQTVTATVHLTDEDLRAVGYMIDTDKLQKKGWEDTYLAALYLTGSLTYSAERAGISTSQVNKRRQNDAVFSELYDQSKNQAAFKLEDAAMFHATHGIPETYTRKDGTVVTRRKYDSRLMVDMLDRFHPELRHMNREDARTALEGGITIKLQIGDGPPPKALPTADVEADAIEDADTDPA
jgi:hypothetical protein